MPLPSPAFDSPVEAFQTSDETVCDPKERPGVHAFIKFVTQHQGGAVGRTVGPCPEAGKQSGHGSGRAWDWMIRADVPEQRARADEMIAWLLANDAEMFRRAGLAYIIWDRKIWSAMRPSWNPYDGYDAAGDCTKGSCRDPHISHVHFSFSWPGADGKTSFYGWLGGDQPVEPPKPPKPVVAKTNPIPAVVGVVAGFAMVMLIKKMYYPPRHR